MVDNFSNICILIPAYQPDQKLVALTEELSTYGYRKIIIINDGSDQAKDNIFQSLKNKPGIVVLAHKKNLGKGEALKTGFKWLLENCADVVGGVTVDADGQHLPKDVRKISQALLAHPESLILGARVFDHTVPLRSRFGNILTRFIFRWKYKNDIRDTQTGLRGIPTAFIPEFVAIPASKYEFEMICLIDSIKSEKSIEQIDVDTVYLDHNASSHFNPLIDSVRIYYVFMRFALTSILAFFMDFIIFVIINFFSHNIFFSLLPARIVSGLFNYQQNKCAVDRVHDAHFVKRQAIKYYILAIITFIFSYGLIISCVKFGMGVITAKFLVDAVLFILNFLIQKKLIFVENAGKNTGVAKN